MPEVDFYAIFVPPLNTAGIPYMVTGSMACIMYGRPRMTHDIDVVVAVNFKKSEMFASLFPLDKFYCPPVAVIKTEMLRENRGHFNIIHHQTGLKADIYTAGADKLMAWGLDHRRQFVVRNETIWTAPPEYVIVQKLHYYREGRSDKHLTDIRGILDNSSEVVDTAQLHILIAEYGLEEYWKFIINPE